MKTIISLLTIIGIAFGSYFYLEGHFAKAEDVKKIEQRLDYKIASDQFRSVQERMWKIEDRYLKKSMPDSVNEEYRQLKEDKDMLKMKLDKLEEKK